MTTLLDYFEETLGRQESHERELLKQDFPGYVYPPPDEEKTEDVFKPTLQPSRVLFTGAACGVIGVLIGLMLLSSAIAVGDWRVVLALVPHSLAVAAVVAGWFTAISLFSGDLPYHARPAKPQG